MGIEENAQSSPGFWREEKDSQALYCLGNFLPGRALERWGVYGLASYEDRRTYYRHTFGSRFDYDGRFPVPSDGALKSRRAMKHYLHTQGVYLKLLTWRKPRQSSSNQPYVERGDFEKRSRRDSRETFMFQ